MTRCPSTALFVTCSAFVLTIGTFPASDHFAAAPSEPNATLTAVPGVRVGHQTLSARPTGCTAILVPPGSIAGVDVRGGAPATLRTADLDPASSGQIDAVSLAGGSAFGLSAASGIVQYLDERSATSNRQTTAPVPVVPSAVLIDLAVGDNPDVRPGAECGYMASRAASSRSVAQGTVGAGAGATVGKSAGFGRAMKGGVGSAARVFPDGLIVGALVVVNAYGDVIEPATGKVLAGVRTPDGQRLADARLLLRQGVPTRLSTEGNSTLGVVATNATLTPAQATRIARMAQDGFGRSISPIHTPFDGDTIFAISTRGRRGNVDVGRLGALAADVVADAVVNAVKHAVGVPGFPAMRDVR